MRRSSGDLQDYWPHILIAGFAVFMFRGIFAPGFMSGYDNSFHYYDAYYLVTTLLPKYRWISGWNMQSMAGLPIFVDYYQAPFVMMAILNKLFLMPLGLAYKTMVLASYIVLGAGFFKIAAGRFGKFPVLIGAICLMLQKDIYLDRILNGIWNNYLAIGIFLIFFHLVDKYIERLNPGRAAVLSLLLGLIILTHIYVAVFACMLLLIYLTPYVKSCMVRKRCFKGLMLYIAIPLLAFMMTSYYLYGFVSARDYFSAYSAKSPVTGVVWTIKSFFGPLEPVRGISGLLLNAPVIARTIFSIFGFWFFLVKEGDPAVKRFLRSVAALIGVSLLLFSDILSNVLRVPFLGMLQTNRLLIYAQIGMYLFAAYGIARYLKRLKRPIVIASILSVLIIASSLCHYVYYARPASKTLENSPYMSDIYRVWQWVGDKMVPSEERIVYQSTIGNVDDPILARSDVFALSGVFTKVPQLGVSRSATPFPQEKYLRNDHGRIFGKPVTEATSLYIERMMNYFNARYIVSVEPELRKTLCTSSSFSEAAVFGRFNIYRLDAFKGGWVEFSGKGDYKTGTLDDEYVRFDIVNLSNGNQAYIKIAYHPFWKAYLDGRPIELGHDAYGLMKVSLPHIGKHTLTLKFEVFSCFWTAFSLAGLATAVCIAIFCQNALQQRPRT